MPTKTATLAKSITKAGSKQTYFIARWLVDKDLRNDCYRAYAYFRWADDVIDVASRSRDERISFIKRQKELVDRLYRNERADCLVPEEEILADLISHDRGQESGLHSFIHNFLAVLEFDAHRKGRFISSRELANYSMCLSRAVTDGIQYFIGNGHPYPRGDDRYQAVLAAHITHMLRDMIPDLAVGFINIPDEYLQTHAISPHEVGSPPFRSWVRERVALARRYVREGKRYLDGLEVLRCKIAGYWYCARYEGVLNTIERDGYTLRASYHERRRLSTWLKIAWLGVPVTLRHVAHRMPSSGLDLPSSWRNHSQLEFKSEEQKASRDIP